MKNFKLNEEAKELLTFFIPTSIILGFFGYWLYHIEPAIIPAKPVRNNCEREGYVEAPFTADQVLNQNGVVQKTAYGYIVVDGIEIDADLYIIGRSDQKLNLNRGQTIMVIAHYCVKPLSKGYRVYFNEVVPKDDILIDRY